MKSKDMGIICENFSAPTRCQVRSHLSFREEDIKKICSFIDTNGLQKDEDLYKFIYKRAAQLKSVIDPINDAYISTQTRIDNDEGIDTLVPDLDALARHFLYFSFFSPVKKHSSLYEHIMYDKYSWACNCEDPILACWANRWVCFEIAFWMECINWRFHEFFSDEEFVIREIEKDYSICKARIKTISDIMRGWVSVRRWMLYRPCELYKKTSSFLESHLYMLPISQDKVYSYIINFEEECILPSMAAWTSLRLSNIYDKHPRKDLNNE